MTSKLEFFYTIDSVSLTLRPLFNSLECFLYLLRNVSVFQKKLHFENNSTEFLRV